MGFVIVLPAGDESSRLEGGWASAAIGFWEGWRPGTCDLGLILPLFPLPSPRLVVSRYSSEQGRARLTAQAVSGAGDPWVTPVMGIAHLQ